MEKQTPETSKQQTSDKPFVPPRHWIGPEELSADYWNNPLVKERRAQEFYDKPIETIAMIDRLDKEGIRRRDFLTLMGASMAMASFSCARRPVHKIIPYVVAPTTIVPGVPNYYASAHPESGYGLLVKTREGRPIKLEGNPDHPVNRGRLDARGQASVLDLYDTDRLQSPSARSRGGDLRPITWVEADKAISAKLKTAKSVRILSGNMHGDSNGRLLKEFAQGFSNASVTYFAPIAAEDVAEGQMLSYGTSVAPHYAFDKAEVIVSLGADFLGTWISPVEFNADWVKNRKLGAKTGKNVDHHSEKLSKFIVFESTMTVTGSNADDRYPIRPGDELKVAAAIAYEIIVVQKQTRFASDNAVINALSGYSPEVVSKEIGVKPEAFKEVAKHLLGARGKGIVVAGGPQTRSHDSTALQVVVNLLNSALENEGETIDGVNSPREIRSSLSGLTKLVGEMKSNQVDVLIIDHVNPAYHAPSALGFMAAMRNVPMVIVVAERDNETARQADYVLPESHFLEAWGDSSPRRGIYSIQQPTIAPIHDSRTFEDCLLAWAKGTGNKQTPLITESADWHAFIMANWKQNHYSGSKNTKKGSAGDAGFDSFWENTLKTGVFVNNAGAKSAARTFKSSALASVPKYSARSNDSIYLALYPMVAMGDGRHANNPWLQEMPDPVTSVTWDNFINVGTEATKKLNLAENDVVEVKSGDVTVQLPVHVQPGMHPNAVSIGLGYGRRSVGKVGNLTGVDVFSMVQVENGHAVFAGMPVKLAKTGRFYQLASTQWHTTTENRPVINEINLAEYRKNPGAADATEPEVRLKRVPTMWPYHDYPGNRWGMSIDLNSCTGCGACTIACQAENNIPVVGRDQVRVSRQMHWIRIDRYFSGSPESPSVTFQPMLCQHCENAPCETVCPVLATVHDDEGVNIQVYNRCVGTRYCQNNCPYKVRRFNFFDHWKSYEGTMNLAWNPDVTVRSRGIMEKCTFCVQRIQEGKWKAKDEGRKVKDGEILTACQQTCPTDAIVFGNINDMQSEVTKLHKDPRSFRLLEDLATMPVVTYMTKVRNVERESELQKSEE